MKKETKTTEQGATHGPVNETDKQDSQSKHLVEQVEIEGTPFKAIRYNEQWFLALGKYRLTNEPLKTLEDVKEEAKDASWHRIMQVVGIMIENWHELKDLNATIDKQQLKIDSNKQLKMEKIIHRQQEELNNKEE